MYLYNIKQTNNTVMKALFIRYNQCTTRYRMFNNGIEFIDTVKTNDQAYTIVSNLEDDDWFTQDNGTVTRACGAECYDPAYPHRFDFGDYTYFVEDIETLDEYYDAPVIDAIRKAEPWNIDEIEAILN